MRSQTVSQGIRCLGLGLAAALTLATPAHAQLPGELSPGATVRVRHTGVLQPYEGRLVSIGRDSLVLELSSANHLLFAIPRGAIEEAWVRSGDHRKTLNGIGIGFLAGAVTGAVAGAIAYQPCGSGGGLFGSGSDCTDFGRGNTAAAGALLVGVAGVGVGGIGGYSIHGQGWEHVQLPAVTLAPGQRTRIAARATLQALPFAAAP